jgi:hypothetical protein
VECLRIPEFRQIMTKYLLHISHTYAEISVNYIWSLFDEIQGFEDIPPRSFQFEDLEWPYNTEFFYSPYLIQAMKAHYVSNADGYHVQNHPLQLNSHLD